MRLETLDWSDGDDGVVVLCFEWIPPPHTHTHINTPWGFAPIQTCGDIEGSAHNWPGGSVSGGVLWGSGLGQRCGHRYDRCGPLPPWPLDCWSLSWPLHSSSSVAVAVAVAVAAAAAAAVQHLQSVKGRIPCNALNHLPMKRCTLPQTHDACFSFSHSACLASCQDTGGTHQPG